MIRNDAFMTARVNSFISPSYEEFQCFPLINADGEEVQLGFFRCGVEDPFIAIKLNPDIAAHLGSGILSENVDLIDQWYEDLGSKMTADDACAYYCAWSTGDRFQAVAYGISEDRRIVLMISDIDTTQKLTFSPKSNHFAIYCPKSYFYNLGRNLLLAADGIEMEKERRFLNL
ncbi:MAG: hypothetical protein IKC24_06680 [Oscillospiraceae bacterium]|nr:hypothetical protein [Oscillospiraceae bacterium]